VAWARSEASMVAGHLRGEAGQMALGPIFRVSVGCG
jgi:hypothetical protein